MSRPDLDAILPPVSAEDEATVDALLAKAREGVGKRPIGSRPDLDAIRAKWKQRNVVSGNDVPTLLRHIDTLEHMLSEERENVDTLRARVAELEGETSMLREQISVRIEDVSMFKRLYEEQIQDDNAARAELEAEVATLRHRDALLKRVHGALADMCCRVPTSIDEPVDAIIRLSLARANQRFVDEYDLRVSAQDWANDLRAELFDWQHAVEYVLGDNWCSADGHDAKAARKALAEWAAKAQGEAPQLLAEIAQLKAQYEAIRLDRDGLHKAYMAALRDNTLGRGELLDERDAALREVEGSKRALADYDRACEKRIMRMERE